MALSPELILVVLIRVLASQSTVHPVHLFKLGVKPCEIWGSSHVILPYFGIGGTSHVATFISQINWLDIFI